MNSQKKGVFLIDQLLKIPKDLPDTPNVKWQMIPYLLQNISNEDFDKILEEYEKS